MPKTIEEQFEIYLREQMYDIKEKSKERIIARVIREFKEILEKEKYQRDIEISKIEALAPSNFDQWKLAYEHKLLRNIGMLRQWLNEDRITDTKKMVTNKDIEDFLKLKRKA